MSGNMRFLADESCDFAAVRALRSAGHDIVSVAESFPAIPDIQVLRYAVNENRVLLTEDKDFGEWVFAHNEAVSGIVLIRYPASMRATLGKALVSLVVEQGAKLKNSFVVLEPGRARIRPKR